MNKTIVGIVVIIIVAVVAFMLLGQTRTEPSTDAVDTEPAEGTEAPEYLVEAELEDVTGGAVVRGITTLPTTRGIARAGFAGALFIMDAEFSDLPEPQGDDFYEGWLVRRGENMSVISTGKLTHEGGSIYTNVFTAESNLLDHDFYVLTLEPNDGDPAPADHILEGAFVQ